MSASTDSIALQLFELDGEDSWTSWAETFARHLCADYTILAELSSGPEAFVRPPIVFGISDGRLSQYRDHFHKLDTWSLRLRQAPEGVPQLLSAVVPDNELLRSELYNDFMRPAGRRFAAGVTTTIGSNPLILVGGRSQARSDFGTSEVYALSRIAPFLRRSLVSRRALKLVRAELEASRTVITGWRRGLLLLDTKYGVISANAFAESLLASQDAVAMRSGQLSTYNRAEEKKLRDALDLAARTAGSSTVLLLSGTRSEIMLSALIVGVGHITSTSFEVGVPKPSVLVILADVSDPAVMTAGELQAAFGFTKQEARVANLLVAGLPIDTAAAQLGLSRQTIRHHLKRLYVKTGRHTQREFVQFVASAFPIAYTPPHNGVF